MKTLFAMLLAALLGAGCKSLLPESATDPAAPEAAPAPVAPRTLLEQADSRLAAADYNRAQALYGEFVGASPSHAQAARARATQAALERLLSSQNELERIKRADEAPRLRRELTERQSELERLRAEVAKLRADIERLRSIDLQTLPGTKR